MSGDLRSWIDRLKAAGDLALVRTSVDWDGEIAEIQRRNLKRRGPALLFENIKGHERTWCRKLFVGGLATAPRVAMMMGMPRDAARDDIVQLMRRKFKEPIAPVHVEGGPVKENIIRGDAVDLFQIPVPRWHAFDSGRYIATWCGVVTMDPDTGEHNVGLYRGVILDRNRIGVLLSPAQHWGTHYAKHQRLGTPMPVAMVFGWDPSMAFTAGLPLAVEEYGVMGAIRQAPVPLCRCETSDLRVPATAEIVVEGTISPDPATYDVEGPYGETTGYYADPRKRPVIKVHCVTFRNDPIYRAATNESGEMLGMGFSATMWNTLEQQDIPGILDVAASPVVAVRIRKTYQGQARHVAAALWGSKLSVTVGKTMMVVDEDENIDIHSPASLLGALSLHLVASRGIVIFPMQLGAVSDPSLAPWEQDELEYGEGLQDKLLVDATVDWTTHPRRDLWGGLRLSPNCNEPSPSVGRLVGERWDSYGIGPAARDHAAGYPAPPA